MSLVLAALHCVAAVSFAAQGNWAAVAWVFIASFYLYGLHFYHSLVEQIIRKLKDDVRNS